MAINVTTRPSSRVTPYTEQVAAAVRAEVARAGVRQRALVALLGLPPSSVSARWRGDTPWTVAELAQIAQHLGVEVPALLPRLDSNQQPAGYAFALVSALLLYTLAACQVEPDSVLAVTGAPL